MARSAVRYAVSIRSRSDHFAQFMPRGNAGEWRRARDELAGRFDVPRRLHAASRPTPKRRRRPLRSHGAWSAWLRPAAALFPDSGASRSPLRRGEDALPLRLEFAGAPWFRERASRCGPAVGERLVLIAPIRRNAGDPAVEVGYSAPRSPTIRDGRLPGTISVENVVRGEKAGGLRARVHACRCSPATTRCGSRSRVPSVLRRTPLSLPRETAAGSPPGLQSAEPGRGPGFKGLDGSGRGCSVSHTIFRAKPGACPQPSEEESRDDVIQLAAIAAFSFSSLDLPLRRRQRDLRKGRGQRRRTRRRHLTGHPSPAANRGDRTGVYRFPALAIGTYSVKFELWFTIWCVRRQPEMGQNAQINATRRLASRKSSITGEPP
jgi:hypothetical protein